MFCLFSIVSWMIGFYRVLNGFSLLLYHYKCCFSFQEYSWSSLVSTFKCGIASLIVPQVSYSTQTPGNYSSVI